MKIYESGQLRDLTQEELEDIKGFEDEQKKMPNKPTIEEQIIALQNALISQKISGGGITTITDSSENLIKDLKILGNSEQSQEPPVSPDNPQEIKNVGKWNEEKQKYEVDVKVTGKNLFDKEKVQNGYLDAKGEIVVSEKHKTSGFIEIKPNTAYYITLTKSIRSKFYDSNKKPINISNDNDAGLMINTGRTFTPGDNVKFVRFSLLNEYLGNTMLSEGKAETPFESYKEQTLTLTSDRPIAKWDKLVEQDGYIGWLYKSRIVPDLAEIIPDSTIIYGGIGQRYFSVNLDDTDLNYDKNKLFYEAGISTQLNEKYSVKPLTSSLVVNINDDDTVETAKKYMHHKLLYNTTKTSKFIPLPQEEQDAIRALTTYYPTTVITVDGGDVTPSVEVTYTADIKNYIDQKINAISKSVVATQKALL